jgi:PmbA protein
MMLDTIRSALVANGQVADYRITETVKHGAEWYFVGSSLDTARLVTTRLYSVQLYVDGTDDQGERTRGAYSLTLHPTSSSDDIKAAVARGTRAAAGMKNPWYPIPGPGAARVAPPVSAFSGRPLVDCMEGLRAALYAAEDHGAARINSLELFLSRFDRRIVNSGGLDVRWTSYSGFVEYIVNAAVPGQEEIELYGDIEFSEPDYQRLTDAVRRRLTLASDRLRAIPTPIMAGLPVLFRDELAAQIYGYWFASSRAQAAYEKTAAFSVGACVADGTLGGDVVQLTAVPAIPGNPRSAPFDTDGQALSPVPCIEAGWMRRLVGPLKYTQYLGIEAVGDVPLFEVAPGGAELSDLESVPHIEAAAFSDFFVEDATGDFGGELRLGYLVDHGERTPIRGGSITGSMAENAGRVRLSRERCVTASCNAPVACLIPVASVASAV